MQKVKIKKLQKDKLSKYKKFIPVNTPLINNADALSVSKSIKSGWISSEGPDVKEFENKIAKFQIVNLDAQSLVELLHLKQQLNL